MDSPPTFSAGVNVAMKLPERLYDQTLAFYRDALGMPVLEERDDGALVQFGPMRLHLDRLPRQSQTDVWLQVLTPDTAAAARHLAGHGIHPCNEVEPLPEGFDGYWIAAPSGTVHLVAAPGATSQG